MTGCGSPTVDGSCFPTLAFKTPSTWNSSNVDTLDWPPTVYIGAEPTIFFALPQATANPIANVRRKKYAGHTSSLNGDSWDDYDGIGPERLEYTLFWTPADGSNTNFTANYVGMAPPPGLVRNSEAEESNPGGTNVGTFTGTITSTPSKPGNYTVWLLLEDKSPSAADENPRLAEYGLSEDPPAEWNQLVVAQHTFAVVEKPKFEVVSFERQSADTSGSAASAGGETIITATDLTKTLDLISGDVTRIAKINLDTFKTRGREGSGPPTFALTGAPEGIFVVKTTGEIVAIPQSASAGDVAVVGLNARAADGTLALIQNISIRINQPTPFVLKTSPLKSRQYSGPPYTDPSTMATTPYFVNENYKISRLQLDEAKTILSDGGPTNSLKYTLDGAPDSWFVSAKTGTITGQFETAGIYNFSLVAADGRKEEQVVETFSFTVVEKKAFKVDGFTRRPSQSRDYTATDYTDPTATTTYAVGDTYRFGSIKVTDTSGTASEPGQLTFTMDGGEAGFLVDPADGFIQGSPTRAGNYSLSLFAVDLKNERAEIETLQIHVKVKDVNVPEYGPNNLPCANNGKPTNDDAEAPFDGVFTCDCAGTPFEGANCENPNPNDATGDSAAIAGSLAAVIIVLVAFAAVLKYKERKAKLKAHDFKETLQSMFADGDLDQEHANNQLAVPREIKRSQITVNKTLGHGQFGDVCEATIDESSSGGPPGYPCAVKTVKEGSAEGMEDLLQEATVMAQLGSHPNVVSLIGVVTSGEPAMLILSICEHGSLKSALAEAFDANAPLPPAVKNQICMDIATGMAHLHSRRFIHRDLAARNVLLAGGMTAKVADFGLTRAMAGSGAGADDAGGGDKDYYRSHRGVFPIRWTAIEAMDTHVFNAATDVWSFGIVMDEVWWDGQGRPYVQMTNTELKQMLRGGGRLQKPTKASDAIYQIMLQCWKEAPTERPSFAQLVELFRPQIRGEPGSGGGGGEAAPTSGVDETSFLYLQPISAAASAAAAVPGSVAGAGDEDDYDMPTGANIALMNGGVSGGGTAAASTTAATGSGPEYEPWSTAAPDGPEGREGPGYDVASTAAPRDGPEYEPEVVAGADAIDAEGYQRPIVAVTTRPAAPTRTLMLGEEDDSMALLSI